MQSAEASGKSVDEAIAAALAQLGVSKEEVDVEILSEGRSGLLGLGAEEATVRVTTKLTPPQTDVSDGEVIDLAQSVLENLLQQMNVNAEVQAESEPADPMPRINLDIYGDDLGILIGRRGNTLSSLQFMVNLIVGRQLKSRVSITVDVEGYRQRRAESLKGLALRMTERVQATGQAVSLEPMPPAERRLIHIALRDHPDVVAESVGEGENRKVVISPR
jgi:spoIIIJ-associated protein